jgi:hypothetical protein
MAVTTRIFSSIGAGLGLLVASLAGITSCGGEDGSLVSPCQSQLSCGKACDAQNPCGQGQHCGGDAKCTAQCVLGDDRCGAGKHCDGSGKCVDGVNIDVGGSSSGTGGGSGECPSTKVNLDNQVPTVLLLVDQSGSMNEPFGTSDRWQTLRTSLMNPTAGIVPTLQGQVRFGLTLYSGRPGTTPCPILTTVAPKLGNLAAIDAAYPQPTSAIIKDTPTGESISAAATILQAVTDPGPKVIVLATDGEPDTCAVPDPQTPEAKEVAVKAAQDAFAAGVFTFYISVGDEVSDMHATEMANVGQGYPRTDATKRFYRANDQKALADAFATIVDGIRTCSFQLNGTVTNGGEADGTVTLDGMTLTLNDPNGWRLSSPTTIELLGSACDTIKNGDKNTAHHIEANFKCGIIVPFQPPA